MYIYGNNNRTNTLSLVRIKELIEHDKYQNYFLRYLGINPTLNALDLM